MKRCTNCVLPETFPNISFNENGVCNFCQGYSGHEQLRSAKQKYKQKFETLLTQYKNKGDYDCLMAYSGGKDSTYTLSILKNDFQLRPLALTFDNGFLSPHALDNIRIVIEKLGIDFMLVKPRFDLLKQIFLEGTKQDIYPMKTLERASTICTSCIGLVKFISLKIAIEKHIPFITYGWSPGQAPVTASIFKNVPAMIQKMQQVIEIPLRKVVGDDAVRPYFLSADDFNKTDSFPYNVSPLAFLDYNEDHIFSSIQKFGWSKPDDTDANSTNCLLNSFANQVHKDRHGFHPYAFEMANMVRQGYLTRDEALEKLIAHENANTLKIVQKKLYD